jgi:hypothetical protein
MTNIYILSEGHCGESNRVVGVYYTLQRAQIKAAERVSSFPFLKWAEQNVTWGNEQKTWMQFDTEGFAFNKIELWKAEN